MRQREGSRAMATIDVNQHRLSVRGRTGGLTQGAASLNETRYCSSVSCELADQLGVPVASMCVWTSTPDPQRFTLQWARRAKRFETRYETARPVFLGRGSGVLGRVSIL